MPKTALKIACCMIIDKQNRILLLKRHSLNLGGGLWATPGGIQEPNEDPAITAWRETKEETGLELESVKYLGTHKLQMPHGSAHIRNYHAQVLGDLPITIDPVEHEAYDWFDVGSLLQAENIIWGLPTTLLDFGLIDALDIDTTLADGSRAILLDLAKRDL